MHQNHTTTQPITRLLLVCNPTLAQLLTKIPQFCLDHLSSGLPYAQTTKSSPLTKQKYIKEGTKTKKHPTFCLQHAAYLRNKKDCKRIEHCLNSFFPHIHKKRAEQTVLACSALLSFKKWRLPTLPSCGQYHRRYRA